MLLLCNACRMEMFFLLCSKYILQYLYLVDNENAEGCNKKLTNFRVNLSKRIWNPKIVACSLGVHLHSHSCLKWLFHAKPSDAISKISAGQLDIQTETLAWFQCLENEQSKRKLIPYAKTCSKKSLPPTRMKPKTHETRAYSKKRFLTLFNVSRNPVALTIWMLCGTVLFTTQGCKV